jgi:hypothetical protein
VKYCHHHFQCGALLLFVHIGGDTPAIVFYAYGIVAVDIDNNFIAIAGQGLIDGVVDNLPNQVVKTLDPNIPDIHGRALSDRLQTL